MQTVLIMSSGDSGEDSAVDGHQLWVNPTQASADSGRVQSHGVGSVPQDLLKGFMSKR